MKQANHFLTETFLTETRGSDRKRIKKNGILSLCFLLLCLSAGPVAGQTEIQETLPSLLPGQAAPSGFDELWAGFDPRAEPLDVETLKEWEEDGVVMRVVRFHIGNFKGQPARLAGIYGFPKQQASEPQKIPGLLQIHGGGQFADHRACLTNAKRGYATLSIAWAGRISAPDYRVDAKRVKLFWENKTDDADYRVTTDWGALDGYHAPTRNPGSAFPKTVPFDWTLDAVESPRNSPWFLCALAARRSLTFLEQQPEVDPERLGVYGHSMGGKLTVMTASDPRVKAAAPSCGGISDLFNSSPAFQSSLHDDQQLARIQCPVFFLSPANDFHGRIGDLPAATRTIQSSDWRIICTPHMNHKDVPSAEVATQIWFDQHLQGMSRIPATPRTTMTVDLSSGVPHIQVAPSLIRKPVSIDVYYTQNGKVPETPSDLDGAKVRYWRFAPTERAGEFWEADLPLESIDQPLWVYANVKYELDEPITGAGYYYSDYTTDTFSISSVPDLLSPEQMARAKIKATLEPDPLIENFGDNWEKSWSRSSSDRGWELTTHKLNSLIHRAPENAALEITLNSAEPNTLVVVLNQNFATTLELSGGEQTFTLNPSHLVNVEDQPLSSTDDLTSLTLTSRIRLKPPRRSNAERKLLGGRWNGAEPEFKQIRWVENESPDGVSLPLRQPANTNSASVILDLFPPATWSAHSGHQSEFLDDFHSEPGTWHEGLDESDVFLTGIRHQPEERSSVYELRVGKGGQIYSLRGSFGESVPPSYRAPGQDRSPWNDEVWQFVAACSRYNGLPATGISEQQREQLESELKAAQVKSSFFVHNSGVYIPTGSRLDSLYCPLLAVQKKNDSGTLRMLNWGLVPQTGTIHRSPLLYYTQIRNAGEGVIELTWVVHNFSQRDDVVFDHLNAPWGGTRVSSLPLHFVSTPEGLPVEREQILKDGGIVRYKNTGGWSLSCRNEDEDSAAVALVFGRDRHFEGEHQRQPDGENTIQFSHSVFRDWRQNKRSYIDGSWKNWKTRPPNSFRNFDVCEAIPRVRIRPRDTIWFRSFLVVGKKSAVIRKSNSLVEHAGFGRLEFDADSTSTTGVRTTGAGDVETLADDQPGSQFRLFSKPVAGTWPLFLIRNATTGAPVVTTDPYYFVRKEKIELSFPVDHPDYDYFRHVKAYDLEEHNSLWDSLLGFAYVEKPSGDRFQKLSDVLDPALFGNPQEHHHDLWVELGPGVGAR